MNILVSASLLILLILFLRTILLDKLPKLCWSLLWDVAMFRLLLPVSLPISLPAPLRMPLPVVSVLTKEPSLVGAAPQAATVVMAQPPSMRLLWLMLWGLGAWIVFGYFMVTHWQSQRIYRQSLPLQGYENLLRFRRVQIRQSDRVDAPLTYGIWRPVILLPKALQTSPKQRLQYIIAHELAHIRHFDALVRWLLVITVCLYWFHPLVWVLYVFARRDQELACDASVIRTFGQGARAEYARTLLWVGMQQKSPLASQFSSHPVEERMQMIMKTKKISMVATSLAILLTTSAATLLAFASSIPETTAFSVDNNDGSIQSTTEILQEYQAFGITQDAAGNLLYKGEPVRYFWDGVIIDGASTASRYERINEEGTIDVHTVRTVIDNGDGSVDPFGALIGIEAYSQEEFEARNLEDTAQLAVTATMAVDAEASAGGKTIAQIFAAYKDYEVVYQPTSGGTGNVYYQGKRMKSFVDISPERTFTFTSIDGENEKQSLYTVYDAAGKLTGVEARAVS